MAEKQQKMPEAAEAAEATEAPFTEMTNISRQVLYLTEGKLNPGETTKFNLAEYSTLHNYLQAK